jgi:GNAT superfamily N-acetyltransferase
MDPGELLIRDLAASDHAALAFIFGRLGEQSRYQRFLGVKRRLDPAELDRLSTPDHWHHGALIAFSPVPRAPIGVARYVRTDDFELAELAVSVVDEWQRRGVGEALMLALRDRALRAGIRRFSATLYRSNRGALALVRRLGPCSVTGFHGDVIELSGSWLRKGLDGEETMREHGETVRAVPGAGQSSAAVTAWG